MTVTYHARWLLGFGFLTNTLAAFALPPVISLEYPIQASTFTAPATIRLAVVTSDPDLGGAVAKVEYFLSGVSKGSTTTSPFNMTLYSVPAGTHTISAKATDNNGEVTLSNLVTVTVFNSVTGNTAPSANISQPIHNTTYSLNNGPVDVPVVFTASDPDAGGSINRVELYVNGVLSTAVPGASIKKIFRFTDPNTYQFSGAVFDNYGKSGNPGPISIKVLAAAPGNTPPVSLLTKPVANATYPSFTNIAFAATATDAGGSINRVEFYRNDGVADSLFKTLTGNLATYTYTMPGIAAGRYTFKVRAYDDLGVYSDSPAVPVIVNTSPTVSITAPANNALINLPASITLQANATDVDGNISKVEFYEGTTRLGEATAPPYNWVLSNPVSGTYAYTAKVYDALGAVATSNVVNVVVNQPPTIGLSVAGALGGYNAPADIVLTATPADADGTISRVELYSGATTTPFVTLTTAPYSYTVVGAPAGSYTYTAKVYDSRSAVTTSNPVSVTVSPALSPATYTYDELGRLIGVQH